MGFGLERQESRGEDWSSKVREWTEGDRQERRVKATTEMSRSGSGLAGMELTAAPRTGEEKTG